MRINIRPLVVSFVLFVIPLLPQLVYAQLAVNKLDIISTSDSIQSIAPREKLYVHLDRSVYALTDTIWFKGYLVGASLNNYSTYSGLIYTELINAAGQVVKRLSLPTDMGLTWGSFALNNEKFSPGSYTFRAYTNWMQNFGQTLLFKKNIQLVSTDNEAFVSSGNSAINANYVKQKNITEKQASSAIDLQFLPEGGTWLPGVSQRIAFKAIDANGLGIRVKGSILDAKNDTVLNFHSNDMGMGSFHLLAPAAKPYYGIITYGNATIKIALPILQENGTALMVNNSYHRDSIKVTVYSNAPSTAEFMLIGQSRGLISFASDLKLNTQIKFIKIPKTAFPTGVCQILLLDEQRRKLNERSFFNDRMNGLKLSVNVSPTAYGVRDSIPLHLSVEDATGAPVDGSFSVAVTDDSQVNKNPLNDENILSYLLLSSDLKGEIEKPGYYFNEIDEQRHNDLDALMLTQGWVSYDWDLHKKPMFKMEKEFAINGKVYGVFQKPVSHAKLTLLGKNKGMLMMDTIANEQGEFTFRDFPLLDSASFVIQAHNKKDKKGASTITIDGFIAPPIPLAKKKPIWVAQQPDSTILNFVATKKAEIGLAAGNGTLLKEVAITGKRVIRDSKNLNGPGEADLTITEEELNKVSKKTLLDLLKEKVKDFNLQIGKGIFLRDDYLKLIIDGVCIDLFYVPMEPYMPSDYYNFLRSYLDNYQAEDIKGLEVMSSYGNRLRYVVEYYTPDKLSEMSFLEITTKTGLGPFVKKVPSLYMYRPIDYGDTKIFYSPKYTVANKNDKKPDLRPTIYWNPNLVTDKNGNAQTSFFSSDKKGSYTVLIEGSDMKGNFGMKAVQLHIK